MRPLVVSSGCLENSPQLCFHWVHCFVVPLCYDLHPQDLKNNKNTTFRQSTKQNIQSCHLLLPLWPLWFDDSLVCPAVAPLPAGLLIWLRLSAASDPHRPRIFSISAHFIKSGRPAWETFTSPLYMKSTSAWMAHSFISRGKIIMGCLHGFSPSKFSKNVEHAASTSRWQCTWWPSQASVTSTNRWPASNCVSKA